MEKLETEYPSDDEWELFCRVYESMYQSHEIMKLAAELEGVKISLWLYMVCWVKKNALSGFTKKFRFSMD
ncbi:hypothetical protein ACMSZQ_003475 [Cronobacter dublinensis]